MCWLPVYAWLRVKIKVKGTGVRIVLLCGLSHGTRQFLMCWLRVYTWLRVKIKAKSTGVRSVLRGGWIIERGNLLCAGYASTRGYASNLRLRVPVFVVFCHGGCIIERGNFLCAGYASTRGYASKLRLRVPVFVLFCGVG